MLAGCAATQLLFLLFVTPTRFANVRWYYAVAEQLRATGLFAMWTPYPPLFSLFLYGDINLLSSWDAFLHGWQALNVALVLAIAAVIHRILVQTSREDASPAAIGFVLVNAITSSAITIGYYFDQYDYIPILLMMLSIAALESDQPVRSALCCAVGAMAKIFPALVLPVAILILGRRRRMQYVLAFAALVLIVTLPWLIAGPNTLRSFLQFTAARGSWETIWTFPRIQFPAPPLPPKYFLVPFDGSGIPALWLSWLTVVTMAAYLAWWRRRLARDVPTAVLALLLILLIFSKGISSYYPFWLFPLIFVVYRPVQACGICLAFLLVGNIEFVRQELVVQLMLRRGAYWIAIWGRHTLLVGLLAHVLSRQAKSVGRTVAGSIAQNPGINPPKTVRSR